MKTILGRLEFALEREILIRAPRATVFRYFTDAERFARWWGAGSSIEGRVGGAVRIVYPGGVRASGEVLELRKDERVVFSYGYEGEGHSIPPGGSRVTITLSDHAQGTQLHLLHEVADATTRDHHVQGWRHHLAVFASAVASETHAGAARLADTWFECWNQADDGARRRSFEALVTRDVGFQDAYGCTRGIDDLVAHVAGARVHAPGITLERTGEPRSCQGTSLVDWLAKGPDGRTVARGTNWFEFTAEARVARVIGYWSPP
jgi:uncharacterized protein YndB with AHSA1/START domain